jgi:hypothetical protein
MILLELITHVTRQISLPTDSFYKMEFAGLQFQIQEAAFSDFLNLVDISCSRLSVSS